MTYVGVSVSFYAALCSYRLVIMGERKAKFKVTFISGLSMLFLQLTKQYVWYSYPDLPLPRIMNKTSGNLREANTINPFFILDCGIIYFRLNGIVQGIQKPLQETLPVNIHLQTLSIALERNGNFVSYLFILIGYFFLDEKISQYSLQLLHYSSS